VIRRPRFLAEQARHPYGILGRLVAFVMARETFAANVAAIGALDLRPSDHALDVGCGHGRGIQSLLETAGYVAGADPSELMAEIAVRRNAAAIKAGRARVVVADASSLPFNARTFDKALCVHVVYFWNDLDAALGEIARVLKPGGMLAMLFRDADDQAAVEQFPRDVYTFPSLTSVVAALTSVGFDADVRHVDLPAAHGYPPRLIVARRSG
jgi:ubiquinone/menaquinone biosynthesis C-methylase UbiE